MRKYKKQITLFMLFVMLFGSIPFDKLQPVEAKKSDDPELEVYTLQKVGNPLDDKGGNITTPIPHNWMTTQAYNKIIKDTREPHEPEVITYDLQNRVRSYEVWSYSGGYWGKKDKNGNFIYKLPHSRADKNFQRVKELTGVYPSQQLNFSYTLTVSQQKAAEADLLKRSKLRHKALYGEEPTGKQLEDLKAAAKRGSKHVQIMSTVIPFTEDHVGRGFDFYNMLYDRKKLLEAYKRRGNTLGLARMMSEERKHLPFDYYTETDSRGNITVRVHAFSNMKYLDAVSPEKTLRLSDFMTTNRNVYLPNSAIGHVMTTSMYGGGLKADDQPVYYSGYNKINSNYFRSKTYGVLAPTDFDTEGRMKYYPGGFLYRKYDDRWIYNRRSNRNIRIGASQGILEDSGAVGVRYIYGFTFTRSSRLLDAPGGVAMPPEKPELEKVEVKPDIFLTELRSTVDPDVVTDKDLKRDNLRDPALGDYTKLGIEGSFSYKVYSKGSDGVKVVDDTDFENLTIVGLNTKHEGKTEEKNDLGELTLADFDSLPLKLHVDYTIENAYVKFNDKFSMVDTAKAGILSFDPKDPIYKLDKDELLVKYPADYDDFEMDDVQIETLESYMRERVGEEEVKYIPNYLMYIRDQYSQPSMDRLQNQIKAIQRRQVKDGAMPIDSEIAGFAQRVRIKRVINLQDLEDVEKKSDNPDRIPEDRHVAIGNKNRGKKREMFEPYMVYDYPVDLNKLKQGERQDFRLTIHVPEGVTLDNSNFKIMINPFGDTPEEVTLNNNVGVGRWDREKPEMEFDVPDWRPPKPGEGEDPVKPIEPPGDVTTFEPDPEDPKDGPDFKTEPNKPEINIKEGEEPEADFACIVDLTGMDHKNKDEVIETEVHLYKGDKLLDTKVVKMKDGDKKQYKFDIKPEYLEEGKNELDCIVNTDHKLEKPNPYKPEKDLTNNKGRVVINYNKPDGPDFKTKPNKPEINITEGDEPNADFACIVDLTGMEHEDKDEVVETEVHLYKGDKLLDTKVVKMKDGDKKQYKFDIKPEYLEYGENELDCIVNTDHKLEKPNPYEPEEDLTNNKGKVIINYEKPKDRPDFKTKPNKPSINITEGDEPKADFACIVDLTGLSNENKDEYIDTEVHLYKGSKKLDSKKVTLKNGESKHYKFEIKPEYLSYGANELDCIVNTDHRLEKPNPYKPEKDLTNNKGKTTIYYTRKRDVDLSIYARTGLVEGIEGKDIRLPFEANISGKDPNEVVGTVVTLFDSNGRAVRTERIGNLNDALELDFGISGKSPGTYTYFAVINSNYTLDRAFPYDKEVYLGNNKAEITVRVKPEPNPDKHTKDGPCLIEDVISEGAYRYYYYEPASGWVDAEIDYTDEGEEIVIREGYYKYPSYWYCGELHDDLEYKRRIITRYLGSEETVYWFYNQGPVEDENVGLFSDQWHEHLSGQTLGKNKRIARDLDRKEAKLPPRLEGTNIKRMRQSIQAGAGFDVVGTVLVEMHFEEENEGNFEQAKVMADNLQKYMERNIRVDGRTNGAKIRNNNGDFVQDMEVEDGSSKDKPRKVQMDEDESYSEYGSKECLWAEKYTYKRALSIPVRIKKSQGTMEDFAGNKLPIPQERKWFLYMRTSNEENAGVAIVTKIDPTIVGISKEIQECSTENDGYGTAKSDLEFSVYGSIYDNVNVGGGGGESNTSGGDDDDPFWAN